jgi:hypothetical protein
MRSLGGSIKDFPNLLAQAYENIAPGGWLELVEFEVWVRNQLDDPEGKVEDEELVAAPMIQKWQAGLKKAGDMIGRRFDVGVRLKQWMEEVGFEGCVEKVIKVRVYMCKGKRERGC